jgi:hypothetical protein
MNILNIIRGSSFNITGVITKLFIMNWGKANAHYHLIEEKLMHIIM